MRSATGLWSRAGLLALLGCLALVVAVTVATPDPAQDYRRRWDDVAVGSWGELENASVRATSVRLTRSLTTEYGTGLTSEATFVVVTLEGRVRRQRVLFSGVTLHTRDDRHYKPRSDYLTAGLGSTDPGFTRAGTAVFEVPDDRLQGAVLEVDRDAAAFDVYASAVRVDLGLDRRSPRDPGPLLIPSSSTVTVTR